MQNNYNFETKKTACLFHNKKIYYSGSIKGAPEPDPLFAWKLIEYLNHNGAEVLSEHVAAPTVEERLEILARKSGKSISQIRDVAEPWFWLRKNNMMWVDQADYFIALVNAPSHGVGMEIERALLKKERGLQVTPILCLVHKERLESLSCMIRGVSEQECAAFYVKAYASLIEAQEIIQQFLTNKLI